MKKSKEIDLMIKGNLKHQRGHCPYPNLFKCGRYSKRKFLKIEPNAKRVTQTIIF